MSQAISDFATKKIVIRKIVFFVPLFIGGKIANSQRARTCTGIRAVVLDKEQKKITRQYYTYADSRVRVLHRNKKFNTL